MGHYQWPTVGLRYGQRKWSYELQVEYTHSISCINTVFRAREKME